MDFADLSMQAVQEEAFASRIDALATMGYTVRLGFYDAASLSVRLCQHLLQSLSGLMLNSEQRVLN